MCLKREINLQTFHSEALENCKLSSLRISLVTTCHHHPPPALNTKRQWGTFSPKYSRIHRTSFRVCPFLKTKEATQDKSEGVLAAHKTNSTNVCISCPSLFAAVCSLDCGLNGVCENGKCRCNAGWTGSLCDQLPCDKRCAEHGQCKNGTCVCSQGWNGRHCTLRKYKNISTYYMATQTRSGFLVVGTNFQSVH